jgi:hypothetical protein
VVSAPSTLEHSTPSSRQFRTTCAESRQRRATASATASTTGTPPNDPDLDAVIDAWPTLSRAVRDSIVAMVKAVSKEIGL